MNVYSDSLNINNKNYSNLDEIREGKREAGLLSVK